MNFPTLNPYGRNMKNLLILLLLLAASPLFAQTAPGTTFSGNQVVPGVSVAVTSAYGSGNVSIPGNLTVAGASTNVVNIFTSGTAQLTGNLATAGGIAWNGTNGSGASAGTLTNAPSIGNPRIFVPLTFNGTVYEVPGW